MRALHTRIATPYTFDYKLVFDRSLPGFIVPDEGEKGEFAMNGESRRPQSNVIAALTYLLGFVTGIIFLYLEPYNQDEFIRFHARQSIGFSVAWFAIEIVFGVFIAVLPHPLGALLNFVLTLINIAVAVFWVVLMYKAYNGERYRIPELADIVDSIAGSPAA